MKKTGNISASQAAGILEVSAATIKNWQKTGRLGPELTVREVDALKSQAVHSRRNKAQLKLNQPCTRYIGGHSRLKRLLREGVRERDIPIVLAETALRLFAGGKNRLRDFLSGGLTLGEGDRLIYDLLSGALPDGGADWITGGEWEVCPDEDVLGFVYASLLPLNRRREIGAYYTPSAYARMAVKRAGLKGRTLDPCCGSGSFLIAAAEEKPDGLEGLYGMDIDPQAVKIARFNLWLRRPQAGVAWLYENIRVKDFLTEMEKYDVITGNPPWGGRPEMSVPFVSRAAELLNEGGRLSLIVPRALLTTRAHAELRRSLLSRTRLLSADYIDNCFQGVYCPAVILAAEAGGSGIEGCRVNDSFTIGKRDIDPRCLNLNVTDEEYAALIRIKNLKNAVRLKGRASFALGVVTGGNRRMLASSGGEPIIRGADISPFKIGEPTAFLRRGLDRCQQAAPEELYRAKEKLVYRFVGRRPVFAVDRLGRLTLNSCNIIIPHIEGLDIDYLAAALNSSAVGFYLEKTFAAEKWLRWMLEEVPIPMVSPERQKEIISSPDWDKIISGLYFE